jgi:hypothetical protein
MAAQTAVGVVLGALVWLRRMRPLVATLFFLLAIALVVVLPVLSETLSGVGILLGADYVKKGLRLSAALATLAALVTRRPVFIAAAVLGEGALWSITSYIKESDLELIAAHLGYLGLLVGVHYRTLESSVSSGVPAPASIVELPRGVWVDDVVAFVSATFLAAVVCRVVLHGWTNSGDEWANTFEAATLAKLRAYGTVPRCSEAFRSFWVFQYMGRTVPEYTPGWPLFMAPFVGLRVAWLAGPASLGVLAAAVSRLGRRAAAGVTLGTRLPSVAQIRASGRFAAAAMVLGSTMLINGASRYPHVFVAAMYAWAVEAMFTIASPGLSRRAQWGWGALLGLCAGLLVSARPADGVMLGTGLAVYFFYALVRGRVPWRALVTAIASLGAIALLSLVILRLQLGKWFTTGYSLNSIFYPWVKVAWSIPKANEYRAGFPIAAGSYCWLPCSPALGLAGLAACRGRAQRLGFVFFLSFLAHMTFYTLFEMGRTWDLGYGPRYLFPIVVPMAIGTGVVFAKLWAPAVARHGSTSALQAGGPLAVALAAMAIGIVRVAPLVYMPTYADVQAHNRLHEAIAHADLHNAVVFAGGGLNNTDPMDLTENLPLDLYPNQDVLVALERNPEVARCVRDLYPQRRFYRAVPSQTVQIVPY